MSLLGHAIHYSVPVRDQAAKVPLAFKLQPLMPLVGGVSDDPVVALLQDPTEVRSVVVPIGRSTAYESVQKLGGSILLEDIDGAVHVKVRRKRVIRCVKA